MVKVEKAAKSLTADDFSFRAGPGDFGARKRNGFQGLVDALPVEMGDIFPKRVSEHGFAEDD